MPWDQNDYLEALKVVQRETDPEIRKGLQREIARYETINPLARPTGVEAFEAVTGARQPTDEELESKVPDIIPEMPQYKRPARTAEGLKSTLIHKAWYEPSIDEFRREMEPVIGVREAESIDEKHPLFQRYADMKWAEAHDAAKKEGKALLRARDIDTSSFTGKLEKAGAEAARYVVPALRGVEEGLTGGLLSSGVAKLEELTGLDPDAMAELEREREQGGSAVRTLGNIGGLVSPGGLAARAGEGVAKLVAPQLGRLVTRAGGSLPSRIAARGGTAAAAGGAGLAAQGGAQDIAQGVNPFSLDFLSRRGEDVALGAATGPAAELLGMGAARLGRMGEVQRARDVLQEGAAAKRLDPILAALGGATAGYSLSEDKNTALLGALTVTALGHPFGRYALLSHLTRRLPVTGEKFFKAAAKELQAAPLRPDVIAAIKQNAIVRGGDVLKPSRGGGSALGIPFTESAAPGPTALTTEEAESFIRQIYDEEKAARDAATGAGEEPEGSVESRSLFTPIGLTSQEPVESQPRREPSGNRYLGAPKPAARLEEIKGKQFTSFDVTEARDREMRMREDEEANPEAAQRVPGLRDLMQRLSDVESISAQPARYVYKLDPEHPQNQADFQAALQQIGASDPDEVVALAVKMLTGNAVPSSIAPGHEGIDPGFEGYMPRPVEDVTPEEIFRLVNPRRDKGKRSNAISMGAIRAALLRLNSESI